MASSRILLFLLSIILQSVALSFAQQPMLLSLCSNANGNFTTNSTYQENLNNLLSSISSNTEIDYGFYNTSNGRNADQVNAIALCRGDINPNTCRSCITNSTRELTSRCPNQKEAIIWYDNCMLRYSNRTIFGKLELRPSIFMYSRNNVTGVNLFNQAVRNLLDSLKNQAASGGSLRKFATGSANGPSSQTIYALVQCTSDLSEQDCVNCLNNVTAVLPTCCDGRQGGRVLAPSCNFRYEKECFYNVADTAPTPSPSLSPAASGLPLLPSPSTTTPRQPPPPPPDQTESSPPQSATQKGFWYKKVRFYDTADTAPTPPAPSDLPLPPSTSTTTPRQPPPPPAQTESPPPWSATQKGLQYEKERLYDAADQTEPPPPDGTEPPPPDGTEPPPPDETEPPPPYETEPPPPDETEPPPPDGTEPPPPDETEPPPPDETEPPPPDETEPPPPDETEPPPPDVTEPPPPDVTEPPPPDGTEPPPPDGTEPPPPDGTNFIGGIEPPPPPTPLPQKGNGGNSARTVHLVVVVIGLFVVVIIFPVVSITTLCVCVILRRRNQQKKNEREGVNEDNVLPDRSLGLHSSTDEHHSMETHCFSFSTIQAATNNFSDKNKLGEGGFGPVYKGQLPNGNEIAVKRLSMRSAQGLEEFKTEVNLLIKVQHKNLVRLLGYCLESDEKLLVYEFMAKSSLDTFLFDPTKSKQLNWDKRVNIIKGTARGLLYLHEDSRLKIIHRDLKASNVLLDDELNPKISDFGTARIFGSKQMEANTQRIVGTYGYIAPEYGLEGLFSIKSDVYSFGILVL